MRLLVVVTGAWMLACSSTSTLPPELADCLDPSACGPGLTPPSPLGRNLPPPEADAGADAAVFDVGIPQGTLPEAGAGPGISGATGSSAPGSSGELGPVCPAEQPTNGAPCNTIANSLPCAYARVTCFCVETWTCF